MTTTRERLRERFEKLWSHRKGEPYDSESSAWFAYQAAYRVALDDAAKVSAAHRAKQAKRGKFTSEETWQTILDEARGEEIAAHEISVKVRALAEGIE